MFLVGRSRRDRGHVIQKLRRGVLARAGVTAVHAFKDHEVLVPAVTLSAPVQSSNNYSRIGVALVDAHVDADRTRSVADPLRFQNPALGCRPLGGLSQLHIVNFWQVLKIFAM